MTNNLMVMENINKSLEAPALDPVLLRIANDALAGDDPVTIAARYGVSPDRITNALDKPEVKRYVDATFSSQGFMNRYKRSQIIDKVIESKLIEAEETGIYTKKDLLDWIKMASDMEGKEKGPKVQINTQTNNIVTLVQDLFKEEHNESS